MPIIAHDGTNPKQVKCDTSGRLEFSPDVTLSAIVTGTITALQGTDPWIVTGTVTAQGPDAHGATITGNPVLFGLEARTTNATAVGDSLTVRGIADDKGRQVIVLSQPRDLVTDNQTTISNATATTILSAGGAGVFHDITSLVVANTSFEAVTVTLRDSTAGTERMVFPLAPKGGFVWSPPVPFKQTTANTIWTIEPNTATSSIAVTVQAVVNT